jgi:ParB family chromosome partitioning protein
MKRRVLGKSIEAIISNKAINSDSNYMEINVDEIIPNPFQPRKKFDAGRIKDLADSLAESGMIQPIVVYKKDNRYILLVGERRWRAAQSLNWKKIPAIISDLPKQEGMVEALVENIQREDLNAIEIAEGIDLLIKNQNLSQEVAGQKLGMNRSTLTNFLRLLRLPELIKNSVISNEISAGHARALLALENSEQLMDVFNKTIKNKLTVRQIEAMVNKVNSNQNAVQKIIDPDLEKIENKLIKLFSTKVKLKYSPKGQGKIEIYFNQVDEFQRIYNLLNKE